MFKTRRLNIVIFTWKPNSDVCFNYSRRLFWVSILWKLSRRLNHYETDVCSCVALKLYLLPRNRRLFLLNQTSGSGKCVHGAHLWVCTSFRLRRDDSFVYRMSILMDFDWSSLINSMVWFHVELTRTIWSIALAIVFCLKGHIFIKRVFYY